jgi:hypothetical protein
MTVTNTINNTVIAEYMGINARVTDGWEYKMPCVLELVNDDGTLSRKIYEPDQNWSQLMNVIKKINQDLKEDCNLHMYPLLVKIHQSLIEVNHDETYKYALAIINRLDNESIKS